MSLFSHVGVGDGSQVIKLGSKCLYALSHLTGTQEEILNGRSRKWEFLNNGVQSHRGFPFPSVPLHGFTTQSNGLSSALWYSGPHSCLFYFFRVFGFLISFLLSHHIALPVHAFIYHKKIPFIPSPVFSEASDSCLSPTPFYSNPFLHSQQVHYLRQ